MATATLDRLDPSLGNLPLARYARLMPRVGGADADALEKAFALGDESALEAAYAAHGALVYTYCRRSLGQTRAQDVTQEVFISAWRAHDRFDPGRGTLAGWLMGIAKNRVIDNLRSERRHIEGRVEAEASETTDSEAERIGDRMLVVEALKTLPERTRQVIGLAYLEDLTHAEVSERLGLPLGTVKSDIRRGLARIRVMLESSDG